MAPKIHNVTGISHNYSVHFNWDNCKCCNMCTTACTFGVLTKSAPKHPPFITPNREKLTVENTETTRVMIQESDCVSCGQCSNACNFKAITVMGYEDKIAAAKAAGKKVVAMIAPSTRVGISEFMGQPFGVASMAQLVSCLRKIGFDYVFDVNFGADQTTLDDYSEIIELKEQGKGPAFTSCCPGWIELMEKEYPQLIPHISTAKSPTATLASMIKNGWAKDMGLKPEDVFTVGIMPCVAKKTECERHQLHDDYNASITTKELADMFKAKLSKEDCTFTPEKEAALSQTEEGQCDLPFRMMSGGANIFGKTAGVAETVLRVIALSKHVKWEDCKITTEEIFKHAASGSACTKITFNCDGLILTGAVCHGGFAIRKCCDMILAGELNVDVVEMMACVGGCINGGGQPKILPKNKALAVKRVERLDALDHENAIKVASENTDLSKWMKEHMGDEKVHHELLFTNYEARYKK